MLALPLDYGCGFRQSGCELAECGCGLQPYVVGPIRGHARPQAVLHNIRGHPRVVPTPQAEEAVIRAQASAVAAMQAPGTGNSPARFRLARTKAPCPEAIPSGRRLSQPGTNLPPRSGAIMPIWQAKTRPTSCISSPVSRRHSVTAERHAGGGSLRRLVAGEVSWSFFAQPAGDGDGLREMEACRLFGLAVHPGSGSNRVTEGDLNPFSRVACHHAATDPPSATVAAASHSLWRARL